VREIAEIKKPPQTVKQIQVKELKEKRPLVKEKEASVFKPGAPPKEMLIKRVERKEVEQPKEIKQPEKGKVSTPTNRPVPLNPKSPGKATSADVKTQNSSLFRSQERVTIGNAERSTKSNVDKKRRNAKPLSPHKRGGKIQSLSAPAETSGGEARKQASD